MHNVVSDLVDAVVVVTVLGELTLGLEVDDDAILVADGVDLGVLDGGQGVSHDGKASDARSEPAVHVLVVQSHLNALVAVLVVHVVNDVQRVDVHASEPLHHVVVLGHNVVVIERIALDGAVLGADLLLGDLVNTAIECIDKLRDTMQSHERCSVVEVMGRNAGYLAMYVGLAVGATAVLVPEEPIDFERDVIEKIRQARFNGFTHYMIAVAKGAGSAADIAAKIKDAIDLDPRVTVLGHIQRGGSPTGRDRVNATKMGYLAVELLLQGKTNRIVCTHMGDFTDVDISEGLAMKKSIQKMEVDVLAAMTGI